MAVVLVAGGVGPFARRVWMNRSALPLVRGR